jgi:hypothetical protein
VIITSGQRKFWRRTTAQGPICTGFSRNLAIAPGDVQDVETQYRRKLFAVSYKNRDHHRQDRGGSIRLHWPMDLINRYDFSRKERARLGRD